VAGAGGVLRRARLAITIVPLALFLFVMFMAIKLIFSVISDRAQRGKVTPYTSHDDKTE
jgi:hypothetical protein